MSRVSNRARSEIEPAPPTVSLAGARFPLAGPSPRLGAPVAAPGAGVRALLTVPTFDGLSPAPARDFAARACERRRGVGLLALSLDHPPVRADWAAAAGWTAPEVDAEFGSRFGILVPRLRLFASALFVIDAGGRLVHRRICDELTGVVDFDAALGALARLDRRPSRSRSDP